MRKTTLVTLASISLLLMTAGTVLAQAPTINSINRQTPTTELSNAANVTFQVNFDQNVDNVDGTDFTTNIGAVTGAVMNGNKTTWDVTVAVPALSSGVLDLGIAPGNNITAEDDATPLGAAPPIGTEQTYNVDRVPPALQTTLAPAGSGNSGETLIADGTFTVTFTFSEAVTGFDNSDFGVTNGTAGALDGGPNVFTAVITPTADFEGTTTLTTNAVPFCTDMAGNGNTVLDGVHVQNVDVNKPDVTSIGLNTPATSPTNSTTLVFEVTFDEAMDDSEYAYAVEYHSGSGSAVVIGVGGTSPTYTVTVNTNGVDGVIKLGLHGPSFQDVAGNPMTDTFTIGSEEMYTVDYTPPTLLSFTRGYPTAQYTNEDILAIDATFDEIIDASTVSSDFLINSTTTAIPTLQIINYTEPTSYSVVRIWLQGGDLDDYNGTVGIDFAAAGTIDDLAGNTLGPGGPEPATDEIYIVDNVAPDLVSTAGPGGIVTSPYDVTITFNEPVVEFTAVDIGVTNGTVAGLSGGPTVWTASIQTITGFEGDVTVTIGAGVCTDAASNANTVTDGTDTQTVRDRVPAISPIDDITMNEDETAGPIPFTAQHPEQGTGFTVYATSSNPNLIPNDPANNLVISRVGINCGLKITPAPDQWGTAIITVTAQEGGVYIPETFKVEVMPVNDPPTASPMNQAHTYIEDDEVVDLDDIVVFDVDFSGATTSPKADKALFTESVTATLTLDNTATGGLTTASGNGETYTSATGVWIVTGDLDGVNAALAAVQFIPAADNDVASNIATHIQDGAGTGPADGVIALTVTPVNDAPLIDDIPDQAGLARTATDPIPFNVDDIDSDPASLNVTGISDNQILLPDANIVVASVVGGTGKERTITLTPDNDVSGTATVTVTVSDGTLTATDTFVYTVSSWPTFTLTTAVEGGGGGTVVASKESPIDSCNWVVVTATPDPGYQFARWSGDLISTENPDSLHMNGDKAVTAHITQNDVDAPVLTHQFPQSGTENVPRNTTVQFKVEDGAGTGVDLSSLQVTVDRLLIVDSGADQTGGLVTIVSHSPAYTVVYTPDTNFEAESTVAVAVQAADLVSPANVMDETYEFTVSDLIVERTLIQMVGPEGAVMNDDSTGIQLTIPAGALDDTTTISVGSCDNLPALPDSVEGMGLNIHFGPDGLQFNDSVIVAIPYTLEDLNNAGVNDPVALELYYFLTSAGEWVKLTIFNADAENVYVKVKEFCYLTYGKSQSSTAVQRMTSMGNPTEFILFPNHPNPFNPVTTITFGLPERADVHLAVYNMTGQLILTLVDRSMDTGIHSVQWDASTVPSGIYFYVIRTEGFTQVRKCMLMK